VFKTVGVVSKPEHAPAVRLSRDISRFLESKGVRFFLESKLALAMNQPSHAVDLEKMRVDLIVTVGGDGTILKTGISIPKPETPILAVNMGRRGFLTEVGPSEALTALSRCLSGDYSLESCMKLRLKVDGDRLPDALNEILVTSGFPSKIIRLKVLREGFLSLQCEADGVIIATPVGSTAHSLSAGGPILDPKAKAFVFTPVCPLTRTYPMVFSSSSPLQVKLADKGAEVVVVVDGQCQRGVSSDDVVSVSESEHKATFVRLGGRLSRRVKRRLLFF